MDPLIEENIDRIQALCKKHFVKKLYLFGSAMTYGFDRDSDVDFFYEISEAKSAPGFDYASNIFVLEMELEQLLKRKS